VTNAVPSDDDLSSARIRTLSPDTNQVALGTASSNVTGTAATVPAKPAPLKLQGIVFNPNRPSAVINGRTLFIGDKIRDMRVVAITPDSATLAGGGHTNVLSLAE